MNEHFVRAVYLGDIHNINGDGHNVFCADKPGQIGILSSDLLLSDFGLTTQQLSFLKQIKAQFSTLVFSAKDSHFIDTEKLNGYVDSIVQGVSVQKLIAQLTLLSESDQSCKAFALSPIEIFKREDRVMIWRYTPQNIYQLMFGKNDDLMNKLFAQFDSSKRVIVFGRAQEDQALELWMMLCDQLNESNEGFIAIADYAPINGDGFMIVEV